jgi:hypothetical protein
MQETRGDEYTRQGSIVKIIGTKDSVGCWFGRRIAPKSHPSPCRIAAFFVACCRILMGIEISEAEVTEGVFSGDDRRVVDAKPR